LSRCCCTTLYAIAKHFCTFLDVRGFEYFLYLSRVAVCTPGSRSLPTSTKLSALVAISFQEVVVMTYI
jgi:hypothetical protein